MMYAVLISAFIGIALMFYRKDWIPYILISVLPLERIPSFDFHGITIRVSLFIIPVAALIYLIEIIKRKQELKLPKFLWWLVFYLAVCVVSVFIAPDKTRAISVIVFLVFAMTGGLIAAQISNQNNYEKMARFLILVSAVVSVVAIYQYIGDSFGLSTSLTGLKPMYTRAVFGFPRVQAMLLEPLYLANFLLLPLSILLIAQIKSWKLFSVIWTNIFIILFGLIFVLTISRGAYLALAVECMVMLVIFVKSLKIKPISLVVMDGILVIILAYGLISFSGYMIAKQSKPEQQKPSTTKTFTTHAVETKDSSSLDRLGTYRVAINQWKKNPVIGNGIGNYGVVANQENPAIVKTQIVNNEPLEILAETGVAGLMAIAGFLISLFILIWKVFRENSNTSQGWMVASLGICLVGILVQYQFFSTFYILHIWFLVGWIIGLGLSIDKKKVK